MPKSKSLRGESGQKIHIIHENEDIPLYEILKQNRNIMGEKFFSPSLSDLHDPFLMPDMEKAVKRVLEAREKKERIVIFGDYDVDGVSSTAILVRFLTEIGWEVSYRLPHRVHDGYGLKSYFFDELSEKGVKLVITVDCGTRDIEPIRHAKSLGIDVIVTDHHAVPDIIPEEVIAILNPKRKDSAYPFPSLAGAGVAFKLLHGILLSLEESPLLSFSERESLPERSSPSEDDKNMEFFISQTLTRYIDLASLGTVADCMPLIGENRTITALGLAQMKNSESAGLRKFLEGHESVEGNADIIGFQIGPRINASGRMDTPLTALRWLLASEDRCDEFLEEIEELNTKRQEVVKSFSEKALMEANGDDSILFFMEENLEHGLIGLVAGKLTEAYNRPSIVLCRQHENKRSEEVKKREYEKDVSVLSSRRDPFQNQVGEKDNQNLFSEGESDSSVSLRNDSVVYPVDKNNVHLVASCRSPDWCNLVELLDECKEYFVRYGGHRQAAGFTIEASRFADFQKAITEKFLEKYGKGELPKKTLEVECILPPKKMTRDTLDVISRFRPFGIGNRKPLFLLEDITIVEVKPLGKEGKHLALKCQENSEVKMILWNAGEYNSLLTVGNIVSLIVELEQNEWNGKLSVQAMIRDIVSEE